MSDGVAIPRNFFGPHGQRTTELTAVRDESESVVREIDLSPWVDEEGVGESAGGQLVEKVFAGPIVVFNELWWDGEVEANRATHAAVGEIIRRPDPQTLRVRFREEIQPGEYSVTFVPQKRSEETNRPNVTRLTFEDGSVESVRDRLQEIGVSGWQADR